MRIALSAVLLAAPLAAEPPAPDPVHAIVKETSGDLNLDTLVVYWPPVRGHGVAKYKVRWGAEPTLESATERTVNQNEAASWVETSISLSGRSFMDYERIYVTVSSQNAGGELSAPQAASAAIGDRPTLRGDVNEDRSRDIGDPLALLFHLFAGTFTPSKQSVAYSSDVNGDKKLNLADVVFLLEWLFHGGQPPAEDAPDAVRPSALLGTFYGDSTVFPMYVSMNHVKAMEAWQGKRNAIVHLFTKFTTSEMNDLFNFQLNNLWNNRNVPLITWEPHPTSDTNATPKDIEVKVAAGEFDAFIRTWGGKLKIWLSGRDGKLGLPGSPEAADDRRAYIRFAHEMNGWWTPWNAQTGGNQPTHYINMWRHVHGILKGELGLDATHVQWIWCVNNVDSDFEDGRIVFPAERYYPGDAFVDWLSLDGYNWGFSQAWTNSWVEPAEVFNGNFAANQMLRRLKRLNATKPISIAEYGCTSITSRTPFTVSVASKGTWLFNALNYAVANQVQMVVYFNIEKETDWAFFGGARGDSNFSQGGRLYQCYAPYKSTIQSDRFITSDPANPRLITDAEFAGDFSAN